MLKNIWGIWVEVASSNRRQQKTAQWWASWFRWACCRQKYIQGFGGDIGRNDTALKTQW